MLDIFQYLTPTVFIEIFVTLFLCTLMILAVRMFITKLGDFGDEPSETLREKRNPDFIYDDASSDDRSSGDSE